MKKILLTLCALSLMATCTFKMQKPNLLIEAEVTKNEQIQKND